MTKMGRTMAFGGIRKVLSGAIIAALFGMAACGTETSEEGNAQPLSGAQLSQAALSQGDIAGYTIRDVSAGSKAGSAEVSDESCRPIADVLTPESLAYDGRLVQRDIWKTPTGSEVADASYRLMLLSAESGEAAEKAVQDLEKAVSSCGSGFEVTLSGEAHNVRQVLLNKSEFGDESVDFSFEYQMGMKRRYVVVSSGASLSIFSASNQRNNAFIAVPGELVDEQKSKLEGEKS
ncbi:hypothetical protein AB0N39_00565 [Streptomyces cellulosae]|uniref:Lipoprotein n=1 Tax=Streptomyces thermocarboxydus TaxID=59299 RepID=A0ABU3J3Y5_9ACTN|nr:hypothetical protein [Streptomyces thermocarboxydus]